MIRTYLQFHCCHREDPFWTKLVQSSTVLYGKHTVYVGLMLKLHMISLRSWKELQKGSDLETMSFLHNQVMWPGLIPQSLHPLKNVHPTITVPSLVGDKCLHPAGAPTMLMITEVGNSMVTITWTTGEERMSPNQLGSDFDFIDLQMFLQISAINHGQCGKNYP